MTGTLGTPWGRPAASQDKWGKSGGLGQQVAIQHRAPFPDLCLKHRDIATLARIWGPQGMARPFPGTRHHGRAFGVECQWPSPSRGHAGHRGRCPPWPPGQALLPFDQSRSSRYRVHRQQEPAGRCAGSAKGPGYPCLSRCPQRHGAGMRIPGTGDSIWTTPQCPGAPEAQGRHIWVPHCPYRRCWNSQPRCWGSQWGDRMSPIGSPWQQQQGTPRRPLDRHPVREGPCSGECG